MAENLTRRILRDHLVEGELEPGSPISLRIDQTLLQDATGTMALMQFEQLGAARIAVDRAVQYIDHNVVQLDHKNPDDHRMLRALASRFGIHFSRAGNGISHYISIERFAKPGQILVGADSHTTTSGALGMIAIGAGGLDVAVAMGGYPYEIACPEVVEVRLEGELAQVCIGSSVNSSYQDLALPGAVLADRGGQLVAPEIAATATPGSRQILTAIAESGVYRQLVEGGVRMLEPVCGPCVGMGMAPPSNANSLRTFNRNFPGRSGTPEDSVFLCSPAVAAVSMLSGRIEDPREYGEAPELLPMPELKPYIDDVHIFPPADPGEAERIEIPRGPNIKTPPEHTPIEDSITARIATVQPDDISTGDLAPDGVEVMSYRSNIPAIAEYTFRHRDPEFRGRLHEWGEGFIIGGHNYGQGSSREHAALAPLQLGVKAVFAKSFARIHRRNLIAQGILALIFKDESDYDRAEVEACWSLPKVKEELEQGAEDITVRDEDSGEEFSVTHDFAPTEREMLVLGGLLNYLKERGEQVEGDGAEANGSSAVREHASTG